MYGTANEPQPSICRVGHDRKRPSLNTPLQIMLIGNDNKIRKLAIIYPASHILNWGMAETCQCGNSVCNVRPVVLALNTSVGVHT